MSVRNAREWRRREAKVYAIAKARFGWVYPDKAGLCFFALPKRYGGKASTQHAIQAKHRRKTWRVARERGFSTSCAGTFTPSGSMFFAIDDGQVDVVGNSCAKAFWVSVGEKTL